MARTSSYLWRNILPYVAENNRAIAPDPIGMGDSDKPEIGYSFVEHANYQDGFIAKLKLKDIVLVGHDWGSALGLHYAHRNPANVRAIALMEPILSQAFPMSSFDALGPLTANIFRSLRTPELGEALILQHNFFVETVLGRFGANRPLRDVEMEHYRRPFKSSRHRMSTLAWPRQMPIEGAPADVARTVEESGSWFCSSSVPKLLFYAEPGALVPLSAAEQVIASARNIKAVFLGSGRHFLQEASPHRMGAAIADWLEGLD